MGRIVPTSLFAAMTLTTTVRSVIAAPVLGIDPAVSVDGHDDDLEPVPLEVPRGMQDRVVLDGRRSTIRWPRAFPAHAAPLSARLIDSVPPEVSTISRGVAPSAAAIRSCASSRAARPARPAACAEDGLPQASRKIGSIASTTSGRSGAVAAWSR